jgi:phenylacetate-CoA ligase
LYLEDVWLAKERAMLQAEKGQRTLAALQTFLNTPLDKILSRHAEAAPEDAALDLFRSVAATVPAYRAFLAEQGIDPAGVRSFADFQVLPLLTKQNYLRRYPLAELCRDGMLESCDMVAVSSGLTGTALPGSTWVDRSPAGRPAATASRYRSSWRR